MWDRDYEDYPKDGFAKKHRVTDIRGCEMRERVGWGNTHQDYWETKKKRRPGKLSVFLAWMFGFSLKR